MGLETARGLTGAIYYPPAGSAPRLGDDNLNVSVGNSFNSSYLGGERRSRAAAQFIELSITAGPGHRSGSGERGLRFPKLHHPFARLIFSDAERGVPALALPFGGWKRVAVLKSCKFGQLNQLMCVFWKVDVMAAVWVALSKVGQLRVGGGTSASWVKCRCLNKQGKEAEIRLRKGFSSVMRFSLQLRHGMLQTPQASVTPCGYFSLFP